MPDVAQLLQSLHPMREPVPPSPIALFLVMLGVGMALASVGFAVFWRVRRRRVGLRRSAQLALAATRALDPPERLAAQAALLRRLVRAQAGHAAARTHGEDWLATLDRTFATADFSKGRGRAYVDALYRRDGSADVEMLDRTLDTLITGLGSRTPAREPAA